MSESKRNFLFTSESVTEGHPDKIADQISDAVLDEVMRQDPKGRVACETLVTTGLVVVAGEITTSAHVNYDEIARETVRQVGYDDAPLWFRLRHLRGDLHRQAPVPRHRHGRGYRRRGRPGLDVRLRLR